MVPLAFSILLLSQQSFQESGSLVIQAAGHFDVVALRDPEVRDTHDRVT